MARARSVGREHADTAGRLPGLVFMSVYAELAVERLTACDVFC